MTVINPKITKDGYVEGLGYDMYNFERKKLDEYKNEYGGITLNNTAFALQLTGALQKYFVLVPIKVKI